MDNQPETATAKMERGIENYRKEIRFKNQIDAIAFQVREQQGRIDQDHIDRAIVDTAMKAAILAFQMIYDNDAELTNLKYERDLYKKFAEETAGIRPMPSILVVGAESALNLPS